MFLYGVLMLKYYCYYLLVFSPLSLCIMSFFVFCMCVPSGFGGTERDEFDVNKNYIFTQGVLAIVILVALGQEMKKLRLDPGMSWFFPSGA